MKIAFFTDTFFPKIDGVVISTIHLAKGLADKGHKVLIFAPRYEEKEEFKYKNVKVVRIASMPSFIYPGLKMSTPLSIKTLRTVIKEKPDIIHFQITMTLGMQAIIIAKLLGIPLVGTFHTLIAHPHYLEHLGFSHSYLQRLSWAFTRAFYNRCNLVSTPSENTRKELVSHDFKNVIALSNGVDLTVFSNKNWKKVRNVFNARGKILLFVGRVAHEKNILYLVDCFKLVHDKIPETKLVVIGDGPQMSHLKQKVKKLGLEKNVIIKGAISHDKLVKSSIFKAVDLFVTASTTETEGITLLEAQANGLACVAVDAGGTGNLIRNNYNGLLARDEDKKGFANAVIKIISNDSLRARLGKNALLNIKKYSIPRIIAQWEKIYKNLLEKAKSS